MPGHLLTAYSIRVGPPLGSDVPLGDIDGSGTALLAVFRDAFVKRIGASPEGTTGQPLTISKVDDLDATHPNELSILVRRGESGVTSYIMDVEPGGQLTLAHHRTDREIEFLEAQVLFRFYPKRTAGLAILHTPHRRGYKTPLFDLLHDELRSTYDRILRTGRLEPVDAWKSILAADESVLHEVKLIKYSPTSDQFDSLPPDTEELVVSLRSGRGGFHKSKELSLLLKSAENSKALLEWQNVEMDELKLTVQIGGRPQTVSITRETIPRFDWDITDEVVPHGGGAPSAKSLLVEARRMADEIEASDGWVTR